MFEVAQKLPWWEPLLAMASEWGVPPWELTGDPEERENQMLWMLRWLAWRDELGRAQRDKLKHN